jgi:hypothetical protein
MTYSYKELLFITWTHPLTRNGHMVIGNLMMLINEIAVNVSSALRVWVGESSTWIKTSVNKIWKQIYEPRHDKTNVMR